MMQSNPCSFCDGELEDKLVQYEYHWEGQLFVFEDVPAQVCRQCGERYFDLHVVEAMERTVLNKTKPLRTLQVPVFSYPDVVSP